VTKAITVDTRTAPHRLVTSEVERPRAGVGEVVIDIASAGVNRADLLQVMGQYPSPAGWPQWPGLEAAGVVAEVGESVTDFVVGQQVCALVGGGAYAEAIAVPADLVLPLPVGLDLIAAGGVMEAACTVWSNLAPHVPLHGGTLLVHGGSGGVGSLAVQLGVARGMRVFTTARGAQRTARCRDELGADLAIDYTTTDFADVVAAEGGADVILDVVGGPYLEANLRALAPHGTVVVIGRQQGSLATLDLGALMGGWATITGSTLRSRPHHQRAAIVADVHREVWPLIPDLVAPVIDRVLPLEQAAQAHAAIRGGEVFGKIVLTP